MQKLISIILITVITISWCLACPVLAASTDDKYAESHFARLNDPTLLPYVEDSIYANLVEQLGSEQYFVEKVEAVYISKEYLEEVAYNSQSNLYFGYTLADLDEQFQGKKYVFTLGDNGQTVVKEMDILGEDVYNKVIKNVAVGTGVILVCVTVSVLTAGTAPAVSLIFAASAKTGSIVALSSGPLSGVVAGAVTGITTKDMDKAIEAAALKGSEGFKWGAIGGALSGGVSEFSMLKDATLNGLTMNEAAFIQQDSGMPLDVIKQLRSMDQYNILKDAGLETKMVNGKMALVRNIDLNIVDEFGHTNLERMMSGLSPLDPDGLPYELHHVGQQMDSTLAILTRSEHRLGDNHLIWHLFGEESQINRAAFDKQRIEFWKSVATMIQEGAFAI